MDRERYSASGVGSVYDHPDIATIIHAALHEDLGYSGDLTCACLVADDARLEAVVVAKQPGVICGLPLFAKVFEELGGGVTVTHCAFDGHTTEAGEVVMQCRGRAAVMLMGERTALNLAQRLSGVATLSRQYADIVAGTGARVYDTRKTEPGLRLLQKHAVSAGGASNHRIGLFDQVLIKENHIALMPPGEHGSGPAEAVRRCRERLGPGALVEVEIERLEDLDPVIRAGASVVLLDNMGVPMLEEAVRIRGHRPCKLEASGGITLDTLRAVAETGVERISVGALTHSAVALDLSLRCCPA